MDTFDWMEKYKWSLSNSQLLLVSTHDRKTVFHIPQHTTTSIIHYFNTFLVKNKKYYTKTTMELNQIFC